MLTHRQRPVFSGRQVSEERLRALLGSRGSLLYQYVRGPGERSAGSAFRVGIFSAKREREVPSEKELSLCRTLQFDLLNAIAFSVGRTKPRPQMDAFSC